MTEPIAKPSKHSAKKIPVFRRQNVGLKKRVGEAWRKPRGIDNKLRVKRMGFGALPRIGYRTARSERGMHPSGARELLVHNMHEISAVQKGFVVRISATVGARKRKLLIAKAKQMGVRILN